MDLRKTFIAFIQCNYRLFADASIYQKLLILPRYLWTLVICFYTVVPYIQLTTVLKPLLWYNPTCYYKLEGVLYSWILAAFSHPFWAGGHTVKEVGDNISILYKEETLMLWNHISSGDMSVLSYTLQHHPGVTNRVMIVMFQAMKWIGLGCVYETHGDFFIFAGQETLIKLEKHLREVYQQRDRKWLVLFPEGTLLWMAKDSTKRFAEKHGLPIPKHVLIPRTGAFNTVMDTLGQDGGKGKSIKYIVDATIGYKGTPPDFVNVLFGTLPKTEVHVLYRIFPLSCVPNEPIKRQEWLYSLWNEKDAHLDHFYKTGEFPNVPSSPENGKRITKRERHLKFNVYKVVGLHLSLIFLTCILLTFWGILLSCALEYV